MMRIGIPAVLGAMLTLTMSASAELDAVSDNYYSMLKVDSQAKTVPIAVPFVAIEAATRQDPISIAEAVDTRTLTQGDMLMIYDRDSGNFTEYEVSENNSLVAKEVISVSRTGEVESNTGGVASEMKVDPGYGSWLIRSNTEDPVILHGQFPYSATVEVKEGKNLIGAVKLSPTDLNDCGVDWAAKGVKETTYSRANGTGRLTYSFGDSIVFTPSGSSQMATLYFIKYGSETAPRWRSIGTKKIDPVIPAGCACWLIHTGDGFSYGMDPVDVPAEESNPADEESPSEE